ncbi:unnamed protein product [Blepharisma stoltei]|uniref:Uncharacterized protein n=1 Tax=Blepharisma stoltei TaxID=1481888 RepID=A0AAU9JPZ3_9CILI|nr:unnamed protein product [Blepharisma stoltei]
MKNISNQVSTKDNSKNSDHFSQIPQLTSSISIIAPKTKRISNITNQRIEIEASDVLDTKPSDSSFFNTENTFNEENSHQFDFFFSSLEDSEIDEQTHKSGSIRKINKKLQGEFHEKISSFREALSHVLCSSARDSARISVLNSELDSIRKNMFEAIDMSHSNHHSVERKSCLRVDESGTPSHWKQSFMIENVLKQIEELQEQIKIVSTKIIDNEKEIAHKNEENLELRTQLDQMEAEFFKYLTNDVNTERASCVCKTF